MRAVLLEALPYRDPRALMLVRGEMRREPPQPYPLSPLDVASLAEDSAPFSGVVAVTGARSFNLGANGEVEHVQGEMSGESYFRLLGIPLALGRFFEEKEVA